MHPSAGATDDGNSATSQAAHRFKAGDQSSYIVPHDSQNNASSGNHTFGNSTVNSNNTVNRPYSYPTASCQPSTSSTVFPSMIGLASTTYQQGYGSSNEVNSDWQYQQWTDSFTAQQQQGTVTNLYDGNVSNEEQHYESIPDLRSYPTTHASGLYGTGYARSAVDSRGIEHTEQQARQSHNVAFNHFHPDAHSTTPTEANSATSNTTYHQTTVISNPYPGIEPVDQRQTATYHQEHIQHLPHQYNAMSSYPSEAIGSTIGNHTSSNLADRNSASLSPPSSVLSSMSTTFRVNITERGTYPRTEQLGPNVDLSPGRSDAVGNDTESANVGAQDIPTRSVVQPSMVSPKRKRRKNTSNPDIAVSSSALSREEAQLDAENGEDGFSVGVDGLGDVGRPGKGVGGLRTSGACVHCKRLKMKCDFPKGKNTCKRCKSGRHVCIVEARKPKIPANKREYLLAQLRQKDAIIESLLKQIHNPYQATPMSIESYLMATSPSDRDNRNTVEWLNHLKSSLKTSDGKFNPFMAPRPEQPVGDDSEPEDDVNPRIGESLPSGDEEAEEDGRDEKHASLHVPLDLLANLSLDGIKRKNSGKRRQAKESSLKQGDSNDTDIGVANAKYFLPGPATDLNARAMLIEQHSPPEILLHGLVTPEDVDRLFNIFYEHINSHMPLLDPVLHTPASTFARCPFLFTVVCAISSRYDAKKSGIYPVAMHFAKHSAANALVDGWKSVELCQAYILMSIYAVPARRWEEDRSWLYTGLAIRLATDLNLHQLSSSKPQSEKQEREVLNKTRVWMICCNLDRSTATQFGKPSTIREHYALRHTNDWYKQSKYNHPYDIHLCGYSALLDIVAKFHDEIFTDPSSPTGLNKSVDFRTVTFTHNERLTRFQEEWTSRYLQDSDRNDRACAFRCSLLPYLVGYSRLVMFSFGFQQAYRRGLQQEDHIFFSTCLTSAKSVVTNMVEGLASSGYMRYAPDGHFVFAAFASAFLLKLLRPGFANLVSEDEEMVILVLISRLIQTLSSQKLAIDDRHTPKLFSRFLTGLLARHRRERIANGHHVSSAPYNPGPPPEGHSMDAHYHTADVSMTAALQLETQVAENHPTFNMFDAHEHMSLFGQEIADASMPVTINNNYLAEGIFPEEDLLETMRALKNPLWWENVMLPGFTWPEQSPSPSSKDPTPLPHGSSNNVHNNQDNYPYMT